MTYFFRSVLLKSAILGAGVSLTTLAVTAPAQAGSLVSGFMRGNDCAGEFGGSFGECAVNDASAIAKFGFNDGNFDGVEINTALFPSVDGSEWNLGGWEAGDASAPDELSDVTWSYSPGTNDPSVLYWTAKAGNGFNLFYYVEGDASACSGDAAFSAACLGQAIATNSGPWFTPDGKALSHVTFYGAEGNNPPDNPESIPEPAALLGLAIAGGSLSLRRRLTNS